MLAGDGFDPDVMNEGGIKVEEKKLECSNMVCLHPSTMSQVLA